MRGRDKAREADLATALSVARSWLWCEGQQKVQDVQCVVSARELQTLRDVREKGDHILVEVLRVVKGS